MVRVQADTARLISLFVGCVLYGILLTTFVPCLQSLLLSPDHNFKFKPRSEIKSPIIAASVLMFLISSLGAVLSMQDVISGFIEYEGPGGALEFYDYPKVGWKHWILAVEDTVQVTLGDGLLIYRCYVIYDRKWKTIALPAVTWAALVAMSITASYREAILPPGASLDDPSVLPFLTATLVLTLSTSVITTYLIIRRLCMIDHSAYTYGVFKSHVLTRAAKIFFETGLIYTLSVLGSLVIYLTGSELQIVAANAMVHIVPITCNLLLFRVGSISRIDTPINNTTKMGKCDFTSLKTEV